MGKVDERKRRKTRNRLEHQRRRQSQAEFEAEIRRDLEEGWRKGVPLMSQQERAEAYQEIIADAHEEMADAERQHREPMQWAREALAGIDYRLLLLAPYLWA